MLSRTTASAWRALACRAGMPKPVPMAGVAWPGRAMLAAPKSTATHSHGHGHGHGGVGAAGRGAALAAAIRQIESSFGKGALMQLGARPAGINVEVIPTGSLALDHALGIGGLPKGRVVEIYGPESSGKTTLALHVVAQAQAMGLNCCFIDAEHALDPMYARAVGVNIDTLFLSQPDTGEQALEIADTLIRSSAMDVLVIDSVAALVPKAEIEGEMGDQHMALQARLMSQALRKLTSSMSHGKALVIFINQIRQKVGIVFGSSDVTPGGNALKFFSSIRMEIRRTGAIKKGEEVVGNTTRVKVAKNKLAPPFRTAEFDMTYGTGISRSGEAVDLGVTFGILGKAGAWYTFLDPAVVAAVNKALAAAATPASPPMPSTAAGGAPGAGVDAAAPAPGGGKKGKKGKAPAAVAGDDGTGGTPATPQPHPSATPGAVAPAVSAIAIVPDEPFLQGKEKMKAFFDANKPALEVVIAAIRHAMKEGAMAGVAPTRASKAGAASRAASMPVDADDEGEPHAVEEGEEGGGGSEAGPHGR